MTQDELLAAALRNPVNQIIADELIRLGLPDAWIVSGCLVQTVWNALTGRTVDYGISDYDVFYFDSDTSIVPPNPGPNVSADKYALKAARWKALWPEITVLEADAD